MWYEDPNPHDQVAPARSRKDVTAHQWFAILAPETFSETDDRGIAQLLADVTDLRTDLGRDTVPQSATLCSAAGPTPTVAVDGTGPESRHTARYFARRSGAEHAAGTTLTAACDTRSHVLAGATVTTGPSNDSPPFRPVLAQPALAVRWDRVLADAASDAEAHHASARDTLGIRSSVLPPHPRGHEGPPGGRYRSPMPRRFAPKPDGDGSRSRRGFGPRWQVASAFPRHKRRLGSAPGGRSPASRERECRLRV